MPWNELEVLDGFLGVPMWWGAARGARARSARCRAATCPVYFIEYNRYFDRPYLYGPPAEGYPDNLERFTFLSRGVAGAVQGARLHSPTSSTPTTGRRRWCPPTSTPSSGLQPLHAAATVYHHPQPRLSGRVRRRRHVHHRPRAASTTTRASSSTSATLNLMKGALSHSTLLSRSARPTRGRSRRRAYGCGLDGVLAGARGDLRRHPERHRRRRVEPRHRSRTCRAHFDVERPARQGRVQGGAAEGGRPARAPRRAAVRRHRAADPAEGVRRAGARAGSDPELGRADRAARHGRPDAERFFAWADAHQRRQVSRLASVSTTAAPTASRRAPTSS